ncbi:MAG: hypothetical protein HY698_07675 [Deltaproteobacteria bacterium]|nr:hypothetical protein [Deltaproteobacteria bacterium]
MRAEKEPTLDLPTQFTDEQLEQAAVALARWLVKLACAEVANDEAPAAEAEQDAPLAKRHAA